MIRSKENLILDDLNSLGRIEGKTLHILRFAGNDFCVECFHYVL